MRWENLLLLKPNLKNVLETVNQVKPFYAIEKILKQKKVVKGLLNHIFENYQIIFR